ncbi:MAG: DUF11 domain-containing protein [Clostridia bacterium]|nr:DUF11 domain-containing protein [Clostridia bacterium]
MKKLLAILLMLAVLAWVFAACGDSSQADAQKTSQDTDTAKDSETQDDTTDPEATEQPDTADPDPSAGEQKTHPSGFDIPWENNPLNGSYISPEAEAIVTVAEAYLARKVWLQYDNKHYPASGEGSYQQYRPQYHENSPEDCTSQYIGYTNCSAFTYDVYWEALGLDIECPDTQSLMEKGTDMHVFTYYITGKETEEERFEIGQRFINTVQQGDIIVCRHPKSGGHALIYIGDGMMIDSAYFGSRGGGNYDYVNNRDRLEVNGSVRYREILSFFEEDNYYWFWDEKCWAIVRPLDKYTDAKPTQKTLNRMENLKNIYVEKLSSHALGQSADLGEEITFSFCIRNDRTTDATLDITDKVPENTTYVSGGDTVTGRALKWTVTVPAGESVTVSYTVRVKDDPALYGGGYVYGEDATVGGVAVRCRKVYIGKHLTSAQSASLMAESGKLSSYTERGMELANALYKNAGIDISLPSVEDIFDQILAPSNQVEGQYRVLREGEYFEMLIPTLYGGSFVRNSPLYDSERTRGAKSYQLYIGDIMIGEEKGTYYAYMYAGAGRVIDLMSGKALANASANDAIISGQGMYRFLFIRPSAVYNDYK